MKIEIKNCQININKKKIVLLTANVILILAFMILGIAAQKAADKLYSQQTAARWENEKNSYAQVSAFASPNRNLQQESITLIRSSLMEALSNDSLNESTGDARIWIDAYSGECTVEVRKDNNTLSVTAVGVGGDFFQFHPIPLLSGGYISSEDLNQDRIVVDENFAWAMFGSNDIVGMQVWMGNNIYTIAGVVAVDEDSLYRTAYGESNRIYMSYDMLKQQQENLMITCYEAVLPNPISNYAYYALRKACGMEDEEEDSIQKTENPLNFDTIEVVENSNRFDWMELITDFKYRKYGVMRTNSVGYPFWENLARVEETHQQTIMVVRILLLICPCICLVLWLYDLWNRRRWTMKGICVNALDKIREWQAQKAEEEQRELEEQEEQEEELSETETGQEEKEEEELSEIETDEAEDERDLSETEADEAEDEEDSLALEGDEEPDAKDDLLGTEEGRNQVLHPVTSEDIFQI